MQIKNIYLPELILVTKSDSNQPASHPISYSLKKINQTKYKMDLTNVTNPFLLAFYEKYNTDWKAYIVRNAPKNVQVADIQDTLFDENFFTTWFKKSIPENQHIVLNGYMNGWYIDQSGDYSIIIEYRPQMLFYQGLFVSGLVLLITFIFLIKQKI